MKTLLQSVRDYVYYTNQSLVILYRSEYRGCAARARAWARSDGVAVCGRSDRRCAGASVT